ncbi:hypothetical protein C8R43DRAFT_592737 [Mycena crocata]|nr:hypothetical protein C8R43DRAFT_592737 [Mycena crocata]
MVGEERHVELWCNDTRPYKAGRPTSQFPPTPHFPPLPTRASPGLPLPPVRQIRPLLPPPRCLQPSQPPRSSLAAARTSTTVGATRDSRLRPVPTPTPLPSSLPTLRSTSTASRGSLGSDPYSPSPAAPTLSAHSAHLGSMGPTSACCNASARRSPTPGGALRIRRRTHFYGQPPLAVSHG